MRELITTIQSTLQDSNNLSYVSNTNIFIAISENLIGTTITFPAIGIKDKSVEYTVEEGESWEPHLYVDLILWQLYTSDDKCITGQGTGSDPYGILKIADDIHSTLFDNKLSLSWIESALPTYETESEIADIGEDLLLIKKVIGYHYRKFEEYPT